MKTLLVYISLLWILLPQCISRDFQEKYESYDRSVVPFEFMEPSDEHKLNDDLYEISGLTYLGKNRLGAIEDERGRLYILDAKSGDIDKVIKFGKKADYEGVELVGDEIYVIESNGRLHSFLPEKEPTVTVVETRFRSKNDVEGLGYDGKHLWIACKASGSVGETKISNKGIYTLSIKKPEAEPKLEIEIALDDLQNFVDGRDRKGKIKEFDPSAIAYDPTSKSFYILSADYLLVVVSPKGKLKEVVFLDPNMYRQPEGICFDPQGDLFLSSEGAGAKARLFRFSRK